MWGQKAPPKHENGGKKRPQNHKVGAESAPAQITAEKVWGQKVPSKCKSGGEKRRQNSKVTAKSATTQISEKKGMVAESAIKMEKWWRKTPSNKQSDGRKCHYFSNLVELQPHISNCGGALTTTYHIQGAGAPAKTKNYVNADAFIFFREKVRPFPHLAKPISRTFGKDEKTMVQIKRDWFDTALKNYERGEMYGRWKEKIQV